MSKRYFAEISYNGSAYHGWQRQPHSITVQETIEKRLSHLVGHPTAIVGCGRTDTGVHATQYFFHFDAELSAVQAFTHRLDRYLPNDIHCRRVFEVGAATHARFDATRRSYEYRIHRHKNPFLQGLSYEVPVATKLKWESLQAVALLIASHGEFAPFCKTRHDAKTLYCDIFRSQWIRNSSGEVLSYHIEANRFLRGMVRLIVGACIEVATGRMSLSAVEEALEQQSPLPRSHSVPAHGLYLNGVSYE